MERVLFDVPAAHALANAMARAAAEARDIRDRVQRLLSGDVDHWGRTSPWPTFSGPARRLLEVDRWASSAAADLRWRLAQVADPDLDLPPVDVRLLEDGRVDAGFVLDGPGDADRWTAGGRLHDDLVRAIDDLDGQAADRLLDRLEALVADPVALAGFAAALGATGLGDLVARLDRARAADPNDTAAELLGGSNPRWDSLKAHLAEIAGQAGGLASYGAADPVVAHLEGGGIQVLQLRDLLLADPVTLAHRWGQDLDLTQSPFVELGGIVARIEHRGPNRTGDGRMVSRVEGTPGSAFHWVDGKGLTAPSYEPPSTWTLVGRTVKAWWHEPGASWQYLVDHPGEVADGFMLGAGLAVAVVQLGPGLVGLTGAQASGLGLGYGAVNVGKQAVDRRPCRTQRVLTSAASVASGVVIGQLVDEAWPLLGRLNGAAGVFDHGLTVNC